MGKLTIEDVRKLADDASHNSDAYPGAVAGLPTGDLLYLCALAERALTMPEGLDERARGTIAQMADVEEIVPPHSIGGNLARDYFHTIRALIAENVKLQGLLRESAEMDDRVTAFKDLEQKFRDMSNDIDRATAAEAEVTRLTALLKLELPSGWTLARIEMWGDQYRVRLIFHGKTFHDIRMIDEMRPTLGAALTDAITKAKEASDA